MTTRFMMKDARQEDSTFRQVTRALYKKAASTHDRAGQPLRTGVTYESGHAVKWLTLMQQ